MDDISRIENYIKKSHAPHSVLDKLENIKSLLKTLEADNAELVECLEEIHSAVKTVNKERGYVEDFDGEEVDFCRLDELVAKHKPSVKEVGLKDKTIEIQKGCIDDYE